MTDTIQDKVIQDQPQAPSVSIQDLAMAVRIIDLASSRGAFQGPDLTPVGTCRDRLAAFVEAQAKAQEAAGQEAPRA